MRLHLTAMALFAALLAAPASQAETPSAPPPSATSPITQDEARNRIEATGYTEVSELRADGRGLWHGRASRNGDPREISLDAQGNLQDSWELAALTMFDRETGELRTAEAPVLGGATLVVQIAH